MNQIFSDTSVFLGMVTTPTEISDKEFYDAEFSSETNGLFKKFKKQFLEYSDNQAEDYLLESQAFSLFGDLDMAILSLCDDFAFGSHIFHPNHPFKNEHKYKNYSFDFQAISGFHRVPKLSNHDLFKQWGKLFHSEKKFPLIGISKIKINSGLLIGVGKKAFDLISTQIELEVRKMQKASKNIDYILIESFCSFEFTLITFSDSYKVIADLILDIRENDLNSLEELLKSETHEKLNIDSLLKILKSIKSECILQEWGKTEEVLQEISVRDESLIANSHLITSTFSVFGYDVHYSSSSDNFYPVLKDESTSFLVNFDVKPGHLEPFLTKLDEMKDELGSSNLSLQSALNGLISTDFTNHFFKGISSPYNLFPKDNISAKKYLYNPKRDIFHDIYKFRTTISHKLAPNYFEDYSIDTKQHLLINELIRDKIYTKSQIKRIDELLRQNRISKILKLRIIKMYSVYNNGMQDRLLYSHFIIFRNFLNYVRDQLEGFTELDLTQDIKHELLGSFVDSFEKSYKNRFHVIHRVNNLTDNNLEYSGGIHQIVTAYNTAYRVIKEGIDHRNDFALVYVSGNHSIDASEFDLNLNYSHIFSSQFFLSIIIKEASNFTLPWKKDLIAPQFDESELIPYLYVDHGIMNHLYLSKIRSEMWKFIREKSKTESSFREDIFKELSFTIDNKLFLYIYADLLNYTYCYLQNDSLFVFWYLSSFFQTPHFYNQDETINVDYLIRYLLRLEIWNKQYSHKGFSLLDALRTMVPKQHIEDFEKLYPFVCQFVDSFFKVKEVSNFIEFIGKERFLLFDELYKPYDCNTEDLSKFRFSIWFLIAREINQNYESNDGFSSKLEKGELIEFVKGSSSQKYIISLCYSVLRKMYEDNNGQIYILKRNTNGIPSQAPSFVKNNKPITYSDTYSGIFTYNHFARKRQFKYNRTIINSIIDFSLKETTKYFTQEPRSYHPVQKILQEK